MDLLNKDLNIGPHDFLKSIVLEKFELAPMLSIVTSANAPIYDCVRIFSIVFTYKLRVFRVNPFRNSFEAINLK